MSLYNNNMVYTAMCAAILLLQFLWLITTRSQSEKNQRTIDYIMMDTAVCICLALSIATLFRLFPGNHRLPNEDSSVFLYIGQRMTEGRVPYRDLFDHKGPLLYWIEYCGLRIMRGSFAGVWFLELMNMIATTALMIKLGRTLGTERSSIYLAVITCLGICGWKVWQGGNYSEEYALPWVTYAAGVFFSFFQKKTYHRHQIVLLGISFMVVFLLRANMIAVWASMMPVVLVLLLKDRRYGDIGTCILLFMLGTLLVLLPVLYMAFKTDSLEAMWRDYIIFNFAYTGEAKGNNGNILELLLYFAKVLWPGTLALLASLLIQPKNKLLWLNTLFFLASLYSASMSGRGYYHYAIILLPAILLPLTECFASLNGALCRRLKTGTGFLKQHTVIVFSFVLILTAAVIYRQFSSGSEEQDPAADYIKAVTERDDDVLILGNSCWYYLLTERKTDNRFFYQLPPLEISEELYYEFEKELTANPSKLVLIPGSIEERERTDTSLRGIRQVLLAKGYQSEEFETFEALLYVNHTNEKGSGD